MSKTIPVYFNCGHYRDFDVEHHPPRNGTQILCLECKRFVTVNRGARSKAVSYRARCMTGDCRYGKRDSNLKLLTAGVKRHVADYQHEVHIYDIEHTRRVIMKISLENHPDGNQESLDNLENAV